VADTVGLPLGEQILCAEANGCVVGLGAYVTDARAAGWPDDRIARELREELRFLGRHNEISHVLCRAGLEAHR